MKAKELRPGNYFTVKSTRDDGIVIEVNDQTLIYMDINDKNTKIIKLDEEVINVF
jgi:hypothetical protein